MHSRNQTLAKRSRLKLNILGDLATRPLLSIQAFRKNADRVRVRATISATSSFPHIKRFVGRDVRVCSRCGKGLHSYEYYTGKVQ